jgi:hypothetical protein
MSFSGFNLGSSKTPSYGTGVNFDGIDTGATFYGQQPSTSTGVDYKAFGESIKGLTPELQGLAFQDYFNNVNSSRNITQLLDFVRETKSPAKRKQALQDTLEFQNAQQAAAAPYNMLYKGLDTLSKLPEQISRRAADRAMNIVLGARNATEAYNLAAASYPRTNFQSTASPVQRNYFT